MKLLKPRSVLAVLSALALAGPALTRADYQSAVLSDGPKAYYRLNDDTARNPGNVNSGTLGAAGNATNDLPAGVVHSIAGAIVGDRSRAAFYDTTARTEIPFNPAINTPNTQPFTIEAWLYPANDKTSSGMAPLANRYTQNPNRQGWVFFQRRPNADYFGTEPVGWNCRMFNGIGSGTKLEVNSLVPYEVGKWQHVVVVYDPVELTNSTLTMYIDGVLANMSTWAGGGDGTEPGYTPCTGDHDPGEAVNGQPALALGTYNNANSSLNPFFGGVDEFAWYSNKLSPEQILAHYQNATNTARTVSYETLVKSHNPVVYLRLDGQEAGPDVAVNYGSVLASGLATHSAEVRHPVGGALAGQANDGAAAYHKRNGYAVTTMPYLADNNPPSSVPFTFEAWLRPMRDVQGGQCPVNNRWPKLGHRTGWVIFQRNPNLTYPTAEGHGWNFRLFDGATSVGQDVLTGTDYKIGEWQHLVVTWEPVTDMGVVNGNQQFQGVLTAYVDGVAVASNTAALYAANINPPEDGGDPADLAIGSYNAASTLGNNPYEGDVDEVAIYNNYVLTPEQILAHYQTGTNSHAGTNYATLVMTAGFTGPEILGLPMTYLRFNDSAKFAAVNSGTTGALADGNIILTANELAGPSAPEYAGFSTTNTAVSLDGLKQWASLNNPDALNFSGQITLEAWVQPGSQSDSVRIISHGPPIVSDFLTIATFPDNAFTNSTEVFLGIEGSGTDYVVGARTIVYTNNLEIGTNEYFARFPVPPEDLAGSTWVHLAGSYDGVNWNLYRNGQQVAQAPGAGGAVTVADGDWAIGATGNGWANNFNGGVDEVAIYDKALSASKIAAHFVTGQAGTTAITINKTGNNVVIAWPAGTKLQEATAVAGPYTDVAGSPSNPLSVPATGTKFYRWKL